MERMISHKRTLDDDFSYPPGDYVYAGALRSAASARCERTVSEETMSIRLTSNCDRSPEDTLPMEEPVEVAEELRRYSIEKDLIMTTRGLLTLMRGVNIPQIKIVSSAI